MLFRSHSWRANWQIRRQIQRPSACRCSFPKDHGRQVVVSRRPDTTRPAPARTRTKLARPGHARLNCTRTRRPFTVTTAATFKRRGNRWPACGTNPDPESTGRSSSTPPSLAKSPAEKSATTWRAPTSAKSTGGACQSGGAVAAGRGCKRPLFTAYSTNFPPRRSTAYGFSGLAPVLPGKRERWDGFPAKHEVKVRLHLTE